MRSIDDVKWYYAELGNDNQKGRQFEWMTEDSFYDPDGTVTAAFLEHKQANHKILKNDAYDEALIFAVGADTDPETDPEEETNPKKKKGKKWRTEQARCPDFTTAYSST